MKKNQSYIKIEVGGLGIIDQVKNQSLLAKWHWRFHEEKTSLWRKVIASRHGTTPSRVIFSLIILRTFKIHWWNKRIHIWSCFLFGGKRWAHTLLVWLVVRTRAYMDTHPSLYALTRDKSAPISDFWVKESESWNLRLRRNLEDNEIEEWASIFRIIQCENNWSRV